MSKAIFSVASAIISATIIKGQEAPSWKYIPSACQDQCSKTPEFAYLYERGVSFASLLTFTQTEYPSGAFWSLLEPSSACLNVFVTLAAPRTLLANVTRLILPVFTIALHAIRTTATLVLLQVLTSTLSKALMPAKIILAFRKALPPRDCLQLLLISIYASLLASISLRCIDGYDVLLPIASGGATAFDTAAIAAGVSSGSSVGSSAA
ncbi:hypothetical protein L204_105396 [Cryptococcus depauperatus]|nr:hypothetical protein L204_02834 [Cryptococcus depauperatus CBS 7855]